MRSMRLTLLILSVFALTACPPASGTEGPQGPAGATGPVGPAGATGATGAMGPAGQPGAMGAPGATGLQGPRGDKGDKGDTGDTGAQGLQGPAGVVTVVDGGVVTGPPGSSVFVTPVSAGATCATGGVRITQLSDGGIVNLCNGAVGAIGPAGAQGIQGLPGAAVTATPLPTMSAQCAAGGVLLQLPDAGTLALCNGATGLQGPAGTQGVMGATGPAGAQGPMGAMGPMGATGATGSQGPQGLQGMIGATGAQGPQGLVGATGPQGPVGATGPTGAQGIQGPAGATGIQGVAGPIGPTGNVGPQGPAGPSGPAGAVLYLDGGVVVVSGDFVEFAGFTVATYTGNLGGLPAANAKCAAEFSGASFCTRADYDLANTTAAAPSSGAWIDYPRATDGTRDNSSCDYSSSEPWTYSGAFNGSGGQQGSMVSSFGRHTTAGCNLVKPLACCRAPAARMVFRGFTTATFTGDLGGFPGAHTKCSSQFPGSSLCTRSDYDLANTSVAAPASGAWIDFSRATEGTRSNSSCNYTSSEPWTFSGAFNGSGGQQGWTVTTFGRHTSVSCNQVKPLACCSRR
jgi:hypothetical protein